MTSNSPTGVDLIAAERRRFVTGMERRYTDGELAVAAAAYAQRPDCRNLISLVQDPTDGDTNHARGTCAQRCYCAKRAIPQTAPCRQVPEDWPLDPSLWQPHPDDRIRELAEAGALIAAEIDRLVAEGARTQVRPQATPASDATAGDAEPPPAPKSEGRLHPRGG